MMSNTNIDTFTFFPFHSTYNDIKETNQRNTIYYNLIATKYVVAWGFRENKIILIKAVKVATCLLAKFEVYNNYNKQIECIEFKVQILFIPYAGGTQKALYKCRSRIIPDAEYV